MAKKAKKKLRSGQKDKRGSALPEKTVTQKNVPSSTETVENGPVLKETKGCPHFEKAIDVVKVSSTISSSEHVKCEDCRVSVGDRRGNKGKAKQGKKKGGSSVDSNSESKAIWVCLECGSFFCGGIGFPTIPQSHAVRHARQTRHQLAIQFENLQLRWCFPCSTLIPVEKNSGNVDYNDPFSDIVKSIKDRATAKVSKDVEGVWFGTGSILSETKSENASPFCLDGTSGYLAKGLVNIGNTCFFNSIMQNLLAMNRLRDYYLELNESVGPLTISFKKIFIESTSESSSRNVINPRSFFGCVCAKAPQFRGYQQHDSHELLLCLLDGLCTEELSARKRNSRENGTSANQDPTFVDAIFGGQLSSTVSCLDCGHSSKVFEQFLDLSLPVPTKKPASNKANQPISRAKKQKLPPKRTGRFRPKVHKDVGTSAESPSVPVSSAIGADSCSVEHSEPVAEQAGDALDSTGQHIVTESGNVVLSNQMTNEDLEKPFLEIVIDNSSWLDYLDTDFVSNDNNTTSTFDDVAAIKYDGQRNELLLDDTDSCSRVQNNTIARTGSSENLGWVDYLEPNVLVDDVDMVLKLDDDSVKQEIGDMNAEQEETSLVNQSVSSINSLCAESSIYPGNSFEDEPPLPVLGSEVLLLPYKEEISSPGEILRGEGEVSSLAAGHQPDALDFDGLGDLFNEPEIVEGPSLKPLSSENNVQAGTSSIVGNTSESDPDEVDNSNSPVSVESCLALFTKPELLSNEHGWNCGNCSKILQEQRNLSMKKQQKAANKVLQNGVEDRVNDTPSSSGLDSSYPSEVRSLCDGGIKKENIGSKADNDHASSKLVDPTLESSSFDESNGLETQFPDEANIDSISTDLCSINGCVKDEVQGNVSQVVAEGSELEGNGDEEINSGSIKVKRDATKRILINKAPPILTIHLKRFTQDVRGRLNKLNGHVEFKDTIDLRSYMDPRCKELDEYKYRLLGVVEHLGTMRGGHYVAYVRGSNRSQIGENNVWYQASDAYVRQVSIQEVLQCEAYILFYEKN